MDSLDGRAIFEALGRRIHAALRRDGQGAGCLRAVPRIDGSLYLDLDLAGQPLRLDWPPHRADDEPLALHPVRPASQQVAPGPVERVTALAAGVLEVTLADPGGVLLRFHNRALGVLTFDEQVVDLLLADRFGPGRTRWFDYVFQDAFQEELEAFRLTFSGPGGPLIFEVRANRGKPPAPSLASNPLFHLLRVEDPRSAAQRGLLAHQVERFLGFLLHRAVHPGMRLAGPPAQPDLGPGADGPGPDGLPGQRTDSFEGAPVSTTRWGNPLQWHQFFSDFEIERAGLCAIKFTDPIAFVVHGETECMTVEPHTFSGLVSFANLPWPHGDPGQPSGGERGFFTGLVEADAIQGGEAKLQQALQRAVSARDVQLVCLNNTCLPKIIGDDVAAAVRRVRQASDVPILSMNTDLDSPDAVYRDLVEQARGAVSGEGSRDAPPGASIDLALLGYPPGPGRRQLVDELSAAGVPSITCLLPEFGIEALAAFLRARVGLIYPHGPWLELTDELLGDLGVSLHPAPAPYGFEGTRRWVQRAAEAVAQPGVAERWRAQALQPRLHRWEAARREAGEHRLAMVVDQASLPRLVDPHRLYGFSLLPLLEEMGFGLDVLVLGDPEQLDPAPLTDALEQPDRLRLHWYVSPEELEALLRDGAFGAVYSEVFFDRRISRAGKAQFHLGMMGMGLDGALTALQDLLDLCRWPFYRRYGRLLAGEG